MSQLTLLVILGLAMSGGDIAKVNEIKKSANDAIRNGDYQTALADYQRLVHELRYETPEVKLNLANTFALLEQQNPSYTDSAKRYYTHVAAESSDKRLLTDAYTQLGIFQARNQQKKQELQKSLNYFKKALRNDPTNEEARYNYELVKKLLEQEEQNHEQNKDQQKEENKEDQQQQDSDQSKEQNQNDQQQQNKDKEGNKEQEQQKNQQQQERKQEGKQKEESEQKGEEQKKEEQARKQNKSNQQEQGKEGEKSKEERMREELEELQNMRLEQINISKEKMEEIMKSFREQEVQFFQQQRQHKEKQPDRSKPDW